jgi:hypothetical protein
MPMLTTMKGQDINEETYISNTLRRNFDKNSSRKFSVPLYCCNYESAPDRAKDPGTHLALNFRI